MQRPTVRTTLTAMLGVIGLAVMLFSYISLSNASGLRASTQEIGTFWMERLLTAREIKGEYRCDGIGDFIRPFTYSLHELPIYATIDDLGPMVDVRTQSRPSPLAR